MLPPLQRKQPYLATFCPDAKTLMEPQWEEFKQSAGQVNSIPPQDWARVCVYVYIYIKQSKLTYNDMGNFKPYLTII